MNHFAQTHEFEAWRRVAKKQRQEDKFLDTSIPYTPRNLIQEISSSFEHLDKKSSIAVLYTVEWAIYLLSVGYQNIKLITQEYDIYVARWATVLGIEYILLEASVLAIKEKKMKNFDVVVGNPPYQNGKDQYFYKEFVEKSFNLTDSVVAMITSANWVSGTGKSKKFFKQIQEKRITHYRYLGTNAFDNVQILTAYFICQPNTDVSTVEIITENGSVTVNRNDFGIVSSGVTDTLDIMLKVKSHSKNKFINFDAGDLARDKALIANSGTKAIFGCGFEGKDFDWKYVSNPEKLAGIGKHKVVFSKNSSIGNIGPIKYADPSFGCAANAYFIEVPDEDTAENLISYLKSKIIKISIKTLKHASCTNSKGLLNQLPLIDISRSWTDAELYTHFELTQEEIGYIEATVK